MIGGYTDALIFNASIPDSNLGGRVPDMILSRLTPGLSCPTKEKSAQKQGSGRCQKFGKINVPSWRNVVAGQLHHRVHTLLERRIEGGHVLRLAKHHARSSQVSPRIQGVT